MADELEKIKISELPSATTLAGAWTIATDANNRSVKVSLAALTNSQTNPPMIGSNGHWFIWSLSSGGYVDSGYVAKGDTGGALTFDDLTEAQKAALRGKSAYQIAVEGGYEGTYEEYAAMLANLGDMHIVLSESQYEALQTKDPTKIYMTYEDE